MASYNKFESFSEHLAEKVANLDTDVIKAYLSNATPSTSADSFIADLAEISAGNGYTAGGIDTQNATSRSGGTTSITGVDVVWTASGAVGPFRYMPIYDDTVTSPSADLLIGWWDYGSSISLANGETFTGDFTSSMFTLA